MDVTAGLPSKPQLLNVHRHSTTTRRSGHDVAIPLPAVGEHHRQVGEHPAPVMAGKKPGRANDSTNYRHSGRTMIDWAP